MGDDWCNLTKIIKNIYMKREEYDWKNALMHSKRVVWMFDGFLGFVASMMVWLRLPKL